MASPPLSAEAVKAKSGKLAPAVLHSAIDGLWQDPGDSVGQVVDRAIVKQLKIILTYQPSLKKYFTINESGVSYWEKGTPGIPPVELKPLTGVIHPSLSSRLGDAAKVLTEPLSWTISAAKFLENLLDPQMWVRIGEIAVGGILLGVGIGAFVKSGVKSHPSSSLVGFQRYV